MSKREDLITQTEARKLAKTLNEDKHLIPGLVAIASPYPYSSWGGHEEGWTVLYVPRKVGE